MSSRGRSTPELIVRQELVVSAREYLPDDQLGCTGVDADGLAAAMSAAGRRPASEE